MSFRSCLCGCLAALFLFSSAGAESVPAEYLINMPPEEIERLEQRLNELGYLAAEADHTYDADTRQALEAFQQANGLSVTGQPDDDTSALLYEGQVITRQEYLQRFAQSFQSMTPIQNGDISNQVQNLQRLLSEYGYFSGVSDGVFGEATQRAVERFQMVNGLPVNGVADGMTLMRLMAEVPITWQGFLSEMSSVPGDAGLNVYALQKRLSDMGYFDGQCTGSYGEYTQRAVTRFQTENGLEATGNADASLWELIYSGQPVSLRRSDIVQFGDEGERVNRVQDRLHTLGYLEKTPDGHFDRLTETALRLFQLAHELSPTGRAGTETTNVLLSDSARAMTDAAVQQRFAALFSVRSADTQTAMAGIAESMVGSEFIVPDDDLYPGFAFVQYVCVAAGLPVLQPEELIRLATVEVTSDAEIAAGNIVVFQTSGSDSVSMRFTIGAGDGRVLYATQDVGWVVASYLSQIDSANIYRWAEPTP